MENESTKQAVEGPSACSCRHLVKSNAFAFRLDHKVLPSSNHTSAVEEQSIEGLISALESKLYHGVKLDERSANRLKSALSVNTKMPEEGKKMTLLDWRGAVPGNRTYSETHPMEFESMKQPISPQNMLSFCVVGEIPSPFTSFVERNRGSAILKLSEKANTSSVVPCQRVVSRVGDVGTIRKVFETIQLPSNEQRQRPMSRMGSCAMAQEVPTAEPAATSSMAPMLSVSELNEELLSIQIEARTNEVYDAFMNILKRIIAYFRASKMGLFYRYCTRWREENEKYENGFPPEVKFTDEQLDRLNEYVGRWEHYRARLHMLGGRWILVRVFFSHVIACFTCCSKIYTVACTTVYDLRRIHAATTPQSSKSRRSAASAEKSLIPSKAITTGFHSKHAWGSFMHVYSVICVIHVRNIEVSHKH